MKYLKYLFVALSLLLLGACGSDDEPKPKPKPRSILLIKDNILYGCDRTRPIHNANIVIPEGVVEIGDDVFWGLKGLSFVDIPNTVKKIGKRAFASTRLRQVIIPSSVEEIGAEAFRGTSLIKIVIPETVKKIGNGAFQDNDNLQEVQLPKNMKTIPNSCFENCSKLKNLKLPSGLTTIGKKAFEQCEALEVLDFPLSLKKIRSDAFRWAGLKEVHLPPLLEYVDAMSFSQCPNLEIVSFYGRCRFNYMFDPFYLSKNIKAVYIISDDVPIMCKLDENGNPKPFYSKPFYLHGYKGTVYVSEGTKEKYEALDEWKYCTIIESDMKQFLEREYH